MSIGFEKKYTYFMRLQKKSGDGIAPPPLFVYT